MKLFAGSSGAEAAPPGYREERNEKTLFMGRIFSVIAIASIVIFAFRDALLFRTVDFVVWGSIGLLPILLFLLLSVAVLPARRDLITPFHFLSLLGLMVATCGYAYTSYLMTEGERVVGGNSPIVLVTTLFFIFIFAAGTRPYFGLVVLPPILALTVALLTRGRGGATALAHLSSTWFFAVAGMVASAAQERISRNEFRMRALATSRGTELETEIGRVRQLNDQLQREIEDRKAIEAELERRAAMDELTDVYNRRAGMEILTQSLYLAQRNKQQLSVCFVDVDDLKYVNDNYGHVEGDRLLKQVITALKHYLRKSDYVARIGGDEFIIVLPNCTEESAQYIVDRITDELERKQDEETPYAVRISTGIAEYPGEGVVVPETLVKLADESMYRSKQAKKHRRRPR